MSSPKKKPKAYERPLPFPVYIFTPLDLKEREALRQIMATDVFRKAIRNAHAQKPRTGPIGTGVDGINDQSPMIANNRLHQLQGWEMFEAALFGQAEERIPRSVQTMKENFQAE